MPAISIIIPIYNVQNYLRRCLQSVLNQTFSDWEAICVNDGSTDGCNVILEEFSQQDKRFKIITKTNGGLSDARNVGMKEAKGEYIIFLDSDDLIHPQTMEIAYFLANKDNSDIVTWYKDKFFRPLLLIESFLGINIDNAVPLSIKRKFSIDKIKSFYTENIFEHAAEDVSIIKSWPIKRCYVWRFLIKKSLINDILFIKGIKYEDFPWWSEVLLKNPKVTITNLPLYYYFPNKGSILLSTGRADKMIHRIEGILRTYELYTKKASPYQMQCWKQNFLWPTIKYHIVKKLVLLKNEVDKDKVRKALKPLKELGLFDNEITSGYEIYAKQLLHFIEK